MGSSMDSITQSLDFPLTTANDIAGRERERNLDTNKDTKSAKLE
jgi:hypothetical protein